MVFAPDRDGELVRVLHCCSECNFDTDGDICLLHPNAEIVSVLVADPVPTIGQGVTICWFTDRKAGTIIAVSKSGHKITIQEDTATRTDNNGMSECQQYTYTPNPQGALHVAYRGKDGKYKSDGKRVAIAQRRTYHDYSF